MQQTQIKTPFPAETKVTVVTTRDTPTPTQLGNQLEVEDEIHWDSLDYTESAFSSPATYKTILKTLA